MSAGAGSISAFAPGSAPKISGTGSAFRISAAVGVLGTVLSLIGIFVSPRTALVSYLIAYAYWAGNAVGALLLLMTFHASNARWMTVVRRPLEAMTRTLPLFAVLFVPIALGLREVYPSWAGPTPHLGNGEPSLIAEKSHWLSPATFVIRTCVYFVIWIVFGELLTRWSIRQDESGEPQLTAMQRRLGAGGLPVVSLALTFAAFDWLMSLDPPWYSTIFGVYWFAGSFMSAFALLIVVSYLGERGGVLLGPLRPSHYHSLGKLMFAFVCFWAYIAFSQFMLIWIANLPEEIRWYLARMTGPYLTLLLVLVFGQFFLPFFVLLSRDLKRRPGQLSIAAVWLLIMHYVDIFWIVVPAFEPSRGFVRWTDLTAFVGIGGLAVAFALFRLGGRLAWPVRDPYLAESLRYSK